MSIPRRIQLRRGTTQEATTVDPVLHAGEPGVETDTGRFKIGNGVDLWSELPYAGGGVLAGKDTVDGGDMVSGVSLWWFDAGGDQQAERPAQAAASDVVIWSNVPSEPVNLGVRDLWEETP